MKQVTIVMYNNRKANIVRLLPIFYETGTAANNAAKVFSWVRCIPDAIPDVIDQNDYKTSDVKYLTELLFHLPLRNDVMLLTL